MTPLEIHTLLARLLAIAHTGLTYTEGVFDKERYLELKSISETLLAENLGTSLSNFQEMVSLEKGYPTPKIDVRAAVFNAEGKVLLVREIDGDWSMPGGWIDIGETPSEAAEREVFEESGYTVTTKKLIGILDKRQQYPSSRNFWHVYSIFFLCDLLKGEAKPSSETTEVAFWGLDELPNLSVARTSAAQIRLCHDHYLNQKLEAVFD